MGEFGLFPPSPQANIGPLLFSRHLTLSLLSSRGKIWTWAALLDYSSR